MPSAISRPASGSIPTLSSMLGSLFRARVQNGDEIVHPVVEEAARPAVIEPPIFLDGHLLDFRGDCVANDMEHLEVVPAEPAFCDSALEPEQNWLAVGLDNDHVAVVLHAGQEEIAEHRLESGVHMRLGFLDQDRL